MRRSPSGAAQNSSRVIEGVLEPGASIETSKGCEGRMKLGMIVKGLPLVLVLTGCSDSATEPLVPNYQGIYNFNGTVNGAPAQDITGTVALTNQRGMEIAYTLNFPMRSNQQPIIAMVTQAPGTAIIGAGGLLTMTFSGPVQLGGRTVQSNLRLDGTLTDRGSMTGTWNLTTTFPTTDAGNFSAQRQ
jgi:hypothetical protein